MAVDPLQLLSIGTSGLDSFGDAMQLGGQASAYNLNAGLAETQAQGVIANADFAARRMRESADRIIATQRARYAKAGVTFSGSAAQVYADTERNLRLDILTTKLNAANKANALGFEALQYKIAAGNAKTAQVAAFGKGILNMATTAALSGVGKPNSVGGVSRNEAYIGRGNMKPVNPRTVSPSWFNSSNYR